MQGALLKVSLSRAALCKQLLESRDREIKALQAAFEARQGESSAILKLRRALKKLKASGGAAAKVRTLESLLASQQEENARLQELNNKLQQDVASLSLAQHKTNELPDKTCTPPNEVALPSPIKRYDLDTRHPWPEWTAFMEYLRNCSYLLQVLPADLSHEEEILRAAMNFSSDRPEIIQSLSSDSLMAFGAFGCPGTDRRIVSSGKRLRTHLNLTESHVCQSCSLSNTCSRANIQNTSAAVTAETSDVVRLLVQFGFDAGLQPAERRPLPEYVETYIRSLLKQVVYFGENPKAKMKEEFQLSELAPGDWRCLKCKAINLNTSNKCRECNAGCGEDSGKAVEWKCIKCSFQNPGESSLCSKCNARKPPKELRWGDWECPGCDRINFARNKYCHGCGLQQPPFKERKMVGFNPNALQLKPPTATTAAVPPQVAVTSLGITPWLLSKEEKEAARMSKS